MPNVKKTEHGDASHATRDALTAFDEPLTLVDSRAAFRNARLERFVQAVAGGATGAEAARVAGFSVVGARQVAHLLLRRPAVRARVDALLREQLEVAMDGLAAKIAAEAHEGFTFCAKAIIAVGFDRLPYETADRLAHRIERALEPSPSNGARPQ